MNPTPIVKSIAEVFEKFGLQVKTATGEEEMPYDAALVDFGLDEKDRAVVLQVLHYSQGLLSTLGEKIQKDKEAVDLSILSFLITVPGEIPEEKNVEIFRLISLANKSLPLGALNFSEVEHSVYYSYNLPILKSVPDETTLLTILHAALFVKETFFLAIDEVSTGKTSLEEILVEKSEEAS